MSLGVLGGLLESSQEYQRLLKALDGPSAGVRVQLLPEAVAFALSTLWHRLSAPMLVIAPRPEDARRLHEQLDIWSDQDGEVLHFPEMDALPFERLASDVYTTQQRLRTLSALIDSEGTRPLVVTSAGAVAQKTIDREAFEASTHTLSKGQHIDLEETLDLWRRIGYGFEATVYGPGTVSRRGGILDIFPVGSAVPARIELWGDEIDSIRAFDPDTQLSTTMMDSITVIPARETLPGLTASDRLRALTSSMDLSSCNVSTQQRISEELDLFLEGHEVEDSQFYAGLFNRGSVLDYFPEDGVRVMYRPTDIVEAAWATDERAHELRQAKERRGELPANFPSSHMLWSEVEVATERTRRRLDIAPWGVEGLADDVAHALPLSPAPGYFGRLDRFVEDVDELAKGGHRVVAVTSVPKRLGEILDQYGVSADQVQSLNEIPAPGSITVLQTTGAGLSEGHVLSMGDHKLVVLSDAEIFGVAKQRRPQRRRSVARERMLSELSPGDYVVHVEHGIGKFLGTGKTDRDDGEREYLMVQYAEGDKLYVPMDHLDRVTPYIAPMDRPPTLTRLGTQEWRRAKERAVRSTREMAGELISLYASRELAEGNAFGPDTPWQAELEDSFPFEETPDQSRTIADVKADMEQSRPMDRLVCGDVGYGKTEIALRAAFKAVMDGKQVAVLVPTTVLAQQHYVTFSQRLRAFPVKVEVLSRFRTAREQRDIVDGLAKGKIDICIGTHRLIQKDVEFKDAGLVIVDEEQRFGVAHKERLKQMREEVDVLTLTATPIPRTLHLSLAGVRDMSTIETPPEERLPIKTYVSEFSDELIREAIRRELDRQGQVFFLHNRVYNIDYIAGYVRMLVPEATVGVGHGQMPEDQLERAMVDLAEGKMDVLVCTTIIESGLDIPNVNTLIVDRADTFGLSQLYQLRGRVGRGARRAYAYLLIPPARSITEAAEKRLKTMLAATELGAGFHIAMKDLEIRGAGNILGAEQSGHIHAVGFDLYTRLLREAVEELRARRESGTSPPDPLSVDGEGVDATHRVGGEVRDAERLANRITSDVTISASVDLGIPASIPEQYVPDLSTRLSVYRKLAEITAQAEAASMQDELVDRFGPLPWQVQNLLYTVRLKLLANEAGVRSIARQEGVIVLRLHDETGGARNALQRLLGRTVAVGNNQVRLVLGRLTDGWEGPLVSTVEKLAEFRVRMGAELGAGV